MELTSYKQLKEQERVSNLCKESKDYVFEFEMFLTEVHSGTVQKEAEKITCISVWILEEHRSFCDISVPTVSTCDLILSCPALNLILSCRGFK